MGAAQHRQWQLMAEITAVPDALFISEDPHLPCYPQLAAA